MSPALLASAPRRRKYPHFLDLLRIFQPHRVVHRDVQSGPRIQTNPGAMGSHRGWLGRDRYGVILGFEEFPWLL